MTDISSNPSNTASGSGSGDTEANTGSGTGSNNGSSASGNENAKNSSEELAKEDSNSGDGTNISDGSAAHREANHRHDPGYFAYAEGQRETAFLLPENNEMPTEKDGKINAISSSTREQKILDKKRKRIVMRREYEAQQHGSATSSESSCDPIGNFFPPGHPLTLDEVLVFSNFPRYVKFFFTVICKITLLQLVKLTLHMIRYVLESLCKVLNRILLFTKMRRVAG